VIIPMAAFKTIRKIKRGQNRPFVQGRDCHSCGGWGTVSSPQGQVTCNACGGRRTR
jgi:ribosomal protein S27E